MNILKTLLTLSMSVFLLKGTAQTVAGYSFEKYSAQKNTLVNKAKINFKSNPTAITFKTAITNGYKSGKIDFAGYYITIFWGCGAGCVSGAMVDTRDGKVYDLPVDEQTQKNFCRSNNEADTNETIIFKKSSRLFITTICYETEIENTSKIRQDKDYLINIWNEQKKKFDAIKTVRKSYTKTTN